MFEHRLLLLAETFPPSVGGIQAYLAGLWRALPPEQSFVVASAQPGDRAWDAAQRFRVARAPAKAWTYPRWRRAWQAARALVRDERIEAVVCGKALFEGRAALRLLKELGIPYVVCTHAMEINTWLKTPKTHRDLRGVLHGAGRVTVMNEPIARLLRTHGILEERIVKIYPGVAEEGFAEPSARDAFRARYGLTGKRVLTCVARLVPRKGHTVLLDAFIAVLRAVPGTHLLLVGDGPERLRLERRVAARGLQGAVTFAGCLSDDDVRRAIAIGELFVLTPQQIGDDLEGFGTVYVEAAALGKAAVASKTGGVPEAVLHGQTGLLVAPGDAAATAKALVELLVDTPLRARLAAAARARADKEFHWKGRALLFQGMIHALLSERAARSTKFE